MNNTYEIYKEKLVWKYKEVFEKVELYMEAEEVDLDTKEDCLMELLDIFYQAQQEKKPVEKIVGSDIKRFCENFCAGLSWKSRLLWIADKVKRIALCIFIFSLPLSPAQLKEIVNYEFDFWTAFTGPGATRLLIITVLAVILYTVMNFLTQKIVFRLKNASMELFMEIAIACIWMVIIGVFSLLIWHEEVLPSIPIWVGIIFGGGYLLIYYISNYKRLIERKKLNKICR